MSDHEYPNEKLAGEAQYSSDEANDHHTQKEQIRLLAEQHGVNQTKLMMKLDLRIVPAICLLYLLAFLDRVNISNASIYGLNEALNLTGNQYNTCLTIFFVPYVVFEIPANYLMKKLSPHVWLCGCMMLFGIVSIAQGFTQNFGGLITTRFFLGLLESGMFPGCFYLLSMWYRRDEAQKRYSFFFSSTCLAGAFGGLVAYGCSFIDGDKGIAGWRWIFIIEGAITAFFSIILFFLVTDFPEDAKWLTENERAFLKAKLELDVGQSSHDVPLNLKGIGRVMKEWKVYFVSLAYFALIISAYSYSYFSVNIIQAFGYEAVETQLRSIYPWICSFGFSMVMAVIADYTRHRFLFAILAMAICGAGYIILIVEHHALTTRYAACFLIASGAYTAMPLIVCWHSQNFAGHHRRAVGTACQIGFGNIGGIIATYAFLSTDAPYYTKGLSICLAFVIFCMFITSGYFVGVYIENRQKRQGKHDARWEAMTPEIQAVSGDLSPDFRYKY